MDKEKCGKYIREKREALGLTKEELAEKLNVGAYDVDCWEAGFFPSAEFLLPLSDALHIDVEELLSGEDLAEKNSAAPASPSSVSEPSFHAPSEAKRPSISEAASDALSDSEGPSIFEAASHVSSDSEGSSISETTSDVRPIANARRRPNCPPLPYLLLLLPKLPRLPLRPPLPPKRAITKNCGERTILDWENIEVPPSGENGFSVGERIFRKDSLYSVLFVVFLIIQGTHFFEYLNRERELTLENYREYIEISVYATGGQNGFVTNPDEYAVRITAKEDIGEFSVVVEASFRDIRFIVGESTEDIVRTVNIGGESLSKGNAVEETLSFDTVVMETGYEVISVEGKLP